MGTDNAAIAQVAVLLTEICWPSARSLMNQALLPDLGGEAGAAHFFLPAT